MGKLVERHVGSFLHDESDEESENDDEEEEGEDEDDDDEDDLPKLVDYTLSKKDNSLLFDATLVHSYIFLIHKVINNFMFVGSEYVDTSAFENI